MPCSWATVANGPSCLGGARENGANIRLRRAKPNYARGHAKCSGTAKTKVHGQRSEMHSRHISGRYKYRTVYRQNPCLNHQGVAIHYIQRTGVESKYVAHSSEATSCFVGNEGMDQRCSRGRILKQNSTPPIGVAVKELELSYHNVGILY